MKTDMKADMKVDMKMDKMWNEKIHASAYIWSLRGVSHAKATTHSLPLD
jgi:hypothetical protein